MGRVLALWCHPRSLSTAFERMMSERGDVTIVHEPFLYLYYVVQNPHLVIGRQLDRIEPWMEDEFDEIVDRIERATDDGPVFFKDMALHVHNPAGFHADERFLGRYTNAFMIRDPAVAILSHLRQNPDMEFEEVGDDAQFALFETVRRVSGETPVVVDAADLERDPDGIIRGYCDAVGIPFIPSALHWPPSIPAHLNHDDPWHQDLLGTTGFERNIEAFDPGLRSHPRFAEYLERSMVYYEAMREHRIGQLPGRR